MFTHVPVLLNECLVGLAPKPGATCIDGTVGGGGHAEALLEAVGLSGRVLGLDQDPDAIARCRARLAHFRDRLVLEQANFTRVADVARRHGIDQVDAILLDLGVSTYQLVEAGRGFSFLMNGPLDMRMDPEASLSAAEIVNEWSQEDIADIIYQYGEETRSRRIARAIVSTRPIKDTAELANAVAGALGGHHGGQRIHPATRTFQALRIAVNDELGALKGVLPQAMDLLRPGGRLAVITFHSLEDRIVKQFVQRESRDCICPPELPMCQCGGNQARLRPITRKPIQPGEEEIATNPRSRSAKLRVAERLLAQP